MKKFTTWLENKDVLKFNAKDALKFFGFNAKLPKEVEHVSSSQNSNGEVYGRVVLKDGSQLIWDGDHWYKFPSKTAWLQDKKLGWDYDRPKDSRRYTPDEYKHLIYHED